MVGRIRNGLRATVWASPLLLLAACQVLVERSADGCDDGSCEPAGAMVVPLREPHLCKDPSMHAIASDLDHLEKHIDWYGSVTAKAPDVWGQARLTSYRQETEIRLRNELDGFRASRQGSLSRTDLADLLVQLSVSNTGQPVDVAAATAANAAAAKTNAETAAANALAAKASAATAVTESAKIEAAVNALNAAAKALTDAAARPPAAGPAGPVAGDPLGVVGNELARATALEPVRILEQKDRYLSYLNQLRRKNEGDDTSDAPGYSLNLVRIPVSLLPGKKTDTGHGAEMTFTVTPILDAELLPNTFKELVVNDLLHLMAFPLTKLLEEPELQKKMVWDDTELRAILHTDRNDVRLKILNGDLAWNELMNNRYGPLFDLKTTSLATSPGGIPNAAIASAAAVATRDVRAQSKSVALARAEKKKQALSKLLQKAIQYSRFVSYSVESKGVRPMPPTQMVEVFGETFLYEIARLAQTLTKDQAKERGGFVHMPDVQAVLREHLIAAYRFLARPESRHLWETFCTSELVDAVRSKRQDWLYAKRKEFREMVRGQSGIPYLDAFDLNPNLDAEVNKLDRLVHFSATSGLAWAILVDSALLNVRLMEDMKRTESVAGVVFSAPDCPQYFLPDPQPAERQAFNEYVKRRWPIHVFTLDPATDEQNLTDSLTVTRNSQLALTLAFLRGGVSTTAFTNAIRKLNFTYETIELNRTQVGFAHGDNTFGWRFYPRFQSPDTQSNLKVFVRDNIIGGPNRDQLLRQRRLEPGPRECVAVVLMPSFVPNATLDAVGNWFALANPKHKTLDHTQALRLSRTVQTIRTDGCGVKDAHKYRADDHRLLLARADQLAARLPLQSTRFQVPTVNSYGGFELFGTSTTDLAPELYGWYGAPGLKPGEDTTLFLVGDHFSVNHTRILIGNMEAKNVKMLSRQVMQVTVPGGVLPLSTDDDSVHAHIHIATPYGVSRELEIPVVCDPPTCDESDGAKPAVVVVPKTPAGKKLTLDASLKMEGKVEPIEKK